MPPKVWHGPHETWVGKPMPDAEKRANEQLADWLFKTAMDGQPGSVLDVGCGYPILLHYLQQHICYTLGIDGDGLPNDLGIGVMPDDFETLVMTSPQDLITFVHTFEHLYDPIKAFKKCRALLADEGTLFIRMPDYQVDGYERDLTDGHYQIHPYYYCLPAILTLCAETECFTVSWTQTIIPGQRDILLRPV